MKVIQWNGSRRNQPMSGFKRYEDELYENIKIQGKGIELSRVYRPGNPVTGNTVASWFLGYTSVDADIVHATVQTLAPVIYIRKPRRFVVTVLDLIPLLYPSVSERLQWIPTPGALRRVDGIIAISDFTKKEVVRILGISESKVHVVYLAADRSKYRPMNKMECKQRLGLSLNEKHILVLSSNNPNKRMDLVQKVFDYVKGYRKDIKLIKAGYAKGLSGEGIINTGWVSEECMPSLYNSADVFLNTSEYEGFCLPVLEAMSCGVPVVASNKASIPEVVGTYGNMVDLDADDAVKQFVDKILSVIDIGLDEKALEQSNKFSWEKTAKETIQIYTRICQELS